MNDFDILNPVLYKREALVIINFVARFSKSVASRCPPEMKDFDIVESRCPPEMKDFDIVESRCPPEMKDFDIMKSCSRLA